MAIEITTAAELCNCSRTGCAVFDGSVGYNGASYSSGEIEQIVNQDIDEEIARLRELKEHLKKLLKESK